MYRAVSAAAAAIRRSGGTTARLRCALQLQRHVSLLDPGRRGLHQDGHQLHWRTLRQVSRYERALFVLEMVQKECVSLL